ncbi:tRNA U34 carboxymethyltransferase [Frankliniella fusca]|uniref:tRNA U34 carboxymethyltransferase n=1 Tax=Frankliniella fusca TaxID=407009 RepID=A0AAE1HF98_9NEOP|nr:tRNA U34 carboxymethyltransferase [Frankliniella fusca]
MHREINYFRSIEKFSQDFSENYGERDDRDVREVLSTVCSITFKIGCPSFIYVTAHSKDLVVEKMEVGHTHSCDPELVAMYPERRSLSHIGSDDGEEEESDKPGNSTLKLIREDVFDLLTLAVDRRRIRNYVRICAGRNMLTGDLANMAKYIRQNPRKVSDERAYQLMEHLKLVESKENLPATRPMTTREKFNAMKRRVAVPSGIRGDEMREDDPEHCYSAGPPAKRQIRENNRRQTDNVIHIENVEHIEDFQDQDDVQGEQAVSSWDPNSSLADVVKSILGPNQEGPVIVHVNNYEGVAVVEVAEAQKYGTGEEIDPSSLLVQKQDESDVPMQSPRRTARKSLSPRKPVIVTNKAENIPTSKVVINTQESTSKGGTIQIQSSQSISRGHQEQVEDYEDEDYNDDYNTANDCDDNESYSEHNTLLNEERTMYRVKTEKLKLQICHLKNDLEKHELEKEKLQLEIRLLELQVAEKERERNKPVHN